MTLFFTLLPIYLLGNIHCFGMCGPLVMMISHHSYRSFYFLGRILSFSLAGMLAGGAGAVLHVFLKQYHISEMASFLFGTLFFLLGLKILFGWRWLRFQWSAFLPLQRINQALSSLMLKEKGWSTFLFGFLTVLLPCGQTLVVFSACALSGQASVGLLNGFAFALLTTPSLFFAMHTHHIFKKLKHHADTVVGVTSLVIGLLTFCRGLAEGGWIPHWTLNSQSPPHYHIVIF